MNPIVHKIAAAIGAGSTALAIGLIIPDLTKAPALNLSKTSPNAPKVAIATNSESRSIRLKNGDNLAVIKVWKYRFNESIPPNTDLKVIREAIASNNFQFILLESEDVTPFWGWYLAPNASKKWQLYPVTQEFINQHPEVFENV